MTKRWSSVRSDLVTTKRAAAKRERRAYPHPDEMAVDWYCHNCSEVVSLNERCKVCGKNESEPS